MVRCLIAALAVCLFACSAQAQGWAYFRLHVHPTHKCGTMREVAASFYAAREGSATSSGQRYSRHAMAAASPKRDGWRNGAVLHLTNPHNGRVVTVRVNDTLPIGQAFHAGVRLDLTPAAHAALGLRDTNWVCVQEDLGHSRSARAKPQRGHPVFARFEKGKVADGYLLEPPTNRASAGRLDVRGLPPDASPRGVWSGSAFGGDSGRQNHRPSRAILLHQITARRQ